MVKTGVVEGVVKTAEADNSGDPIGTAAKCIADARGLAADLEASLKNIGKEAEKDKKEADK